MTIFFTGDTHLGDSSILKHQEREGNTIEDHDDAIVRAWNAVVKRGDVVYHAGDFARRRPDAYLRRLNGQIHLTEGNHDRLNAASKALFASFHQITKVKVKADNQLIYVSHYAMRVWNRSHYGSWNLYGHSHGSLDDDPHARAIDVGWDVWKRPISYEEIVPIMAAKQWRPKDHHRPKGYRTLEEKVKSILGRRYKHVDTGLNVELTGQVRSVPQHCGSGFATPGPVEVEVIFVDTYLRLSAWYKVEKIEGLALAL